MCAWVVSMAESRVYDSIGVRIFLGMFAILVTIEYLKWSLPRGGLEHRLSTRGRLLLVDASIAMIYPASFVRLSLDMSVSFFADNNADMGRAVHIPGCRRATLYHARCDAHVSRTQQRVTIAWELFTLVDTCCNDSRSYMLFCPLRI